MTRLIGLLVLINVAACRSAMGPRLISEDTFGPGALSRYTAYSDDGNPWSVAENVLRGSGLGIHSVLIRKSVVLPDGYVEAVMDSADDGGLVLRFTDNENYYLLAIRDDKALSPRNLDNLEVYRRSGIGQGGFVSLWRMNVNWPRGTPHQVGFEVSGDSLRVYFDSNRVGSIADPVHMSGGGVGVRHYGNSAFWISRYSRFSWGKRSNIATALAIPSIASGAYGQGRPDKASSYAAPLVIGETFTLNSRVLHEVRRINVYLPAGYMESKSVRMPVLYMPDGGMAEDFLHVAGLVQVSVGNATMRPFILVGIENTERRRDMTGPTTNPEDKKIAPRVGGSAAFRQFIRTELMPAIKARYRTTSETAIVGESLAGLFVVETLMREPDMFDTYIAFDPSLWWNNHKLLADADSLLRTNLKKPKTLFFASSDEPELVRNSQQLDSLLKAGVFKNLKWRYIPLPHETHGTIYHPAALQAFRQLFKPVTAR